MRARGTLFASITLAAGISSTGDPELDRRLPFDEPYRIPDATASAIRRTRSAGGRIVAVGTTVVRALEHAAARAGVVRPGHGVADQRLGPSSSLRVVDAILSGTHEPGSSHYQLLRAFLDDATLAEVSAALEARGYRTHEFGDSMLVANMRARSHLILRSVRLQADCHGPAACPPQLEHNNERRWEAGHYVRGDCPVQQPAGGPLTLPSGTRTDRGADRGEETGFVEGLVEMRGESGGLGFHVIGAADEARYGDHRRPIAVGP
jgi:hypothetical protein